MENKKKKGAPHVLVLPFPAQGHINPMLGFCKRLTSYGLKTTFATTVFFSKSFTLTPSPSIQYDTISDGFDDGFFVLDESNVEEYLARLVSVGSKTLADLITRHKTSSNPIDCVVYDSHLPWALNVAKQFGLAGAAFFTQACTVDYVYYCVHHQVLNLPISSFPVTVDGLRLLSQLEDMPSFIGVEGSYPVYLETVLSQFSNAQEADFIFVNSVYEWEKEVVDSMSKVCCQLLTIGPTIPSIYLDNRVRDDKEYGFNLFTSDSSIAIANWLNDKPQNSIVYVSFGSLACLNDKQMEELALGLKASSLFFLWVVRATEQSKLPKNFAKETREKGLIVKWCPQMEVLSHPSIGCFLTHCGWNSTIEALSLGVPMVGMPQWTDQPTDAKLVQDLWKVGVRAKADDNGIVGRKEIEYCIRQVMERDTSVEMRKNAKKWSNVALQAISDGGSSDSNILKFISSLIN